jgi:lipopolysaccharide export system protein LptA
MRQPALPLLAILLAAPLATAALPAHAQPIDMSQGGPVEVTAAGGFEWRQQEQKVIASGDARAVRDNVTVTADRLIALYRKRTTPGDTAQAAPAASSNGIDSGSTEVYRLEAEGNVRITTTTDQAQGDHAVYDIDQAVLVLTGRNLRLTTPQQLMTARDSMEYWSQQHMAVGRGNAVVLTTDGRRIAADTLVGYTTPNAQTPNGQTPNGQTPNGQPPGTLPPATQAAAKPGADPLEASGKLQRVEAFGNVEVRTTADTVRGDRGVYVQDTGMARIVGHVRITHGQNQLNGPAADVNMNTGIAHMISDPGQRVQGLIMPNDANAATAPGRPATPPPASPAPKR